MKGLIRFGFILISLSFGNWTRLLEAPEYPRELYVVGVGLSEINVDQAKKNAANDIAKQIRQQLRSKVVDWQKENSKSIHSSYDETWSRSIQVSFAEISGVEFVKEKREDDIYYVMAVLDKGKFASIQRVKLAEIFREIRIYQRKLNSGDFDTAFNDLLQIRQLMRDAEEVRFDLSAVDEIRESDLTPVTMAEVESFYLELIRDLRLQNVSGDAQVIKDNSLTAKPWIIQVFHKDQTISGIEVSVFNQTGRRIFKTYSDINGRIEIFPHVWFDRTLNKGRYRIQVDVPVPASMSRHLINTGIWYSYEYEPSKCPVNWIYSKELRLYSKQISSKLNSMGFLESKSAPQVLLSLNHDSKSLITGLSGLRSRKQISAQLSIKMESFEEKINWSHIFVPGEDSLAQALVNIPMSQEWIRLRDKICKDGVSEKLILWMGMELDSEVSLWNDAFKLHRLQAEIFDLAGDRLLSSKDSEGFYFDWMNSELEKENFIFREQGELQKKVDYVIYGRFSKDGVYLVKIDLSSLQKMEVEMNLNHFESSKWKESVRKLLQ
jgi:hypothetical protein